jgi:hypothetical protein
MRFFAATEIPLEGVIVAAARQGWRRQGRQTKAQHMGGAMDAPGLTGKDKDMNQITTHKKTSGQRE